MRIFRVPTKCSSEQNSHPQVDLPSCCVVLVNGERLQASILQREQKVRSRTVNYVAKRALVARERRIAVTSGVLECAYVASERVVLPKCGVEFQFCRRTVFKLCPAAHCVERKHGGAGINQRSVPQHAASNPAAQAADRLPAIKRSAQHKPAVERKVPVSHRGVPVDVAPVSVVLAAVVTGGCNGEGMTEQRMGIR